MYKFIDIPLILSIIFFVLYKLTFVWVQVLHFNPN